jgi:hypothetical protein
MLIGNWRANDLRRAFVVGAQWWEWTKEHATMWPSDQDMAEDEAERRYPAGKPPPAPSRGRKDPA